MTLPFIHKSFYQHTAKLAIELKSKECEVEKKEQLLLKHISELIAEVEKAGKEPQAEPIKLAIRRCFKETQKVLTAWEHEVRCYEKSLRLRDKHGDSLLIFIYGKVKAGKSALGNYIATGCEKPDENYIAQLHAQKHHPDFFIEAQNHEFDEKINHKQGFLVGVQETTSCIQGFRLPGLTWIDSPGLHSVNKANGNLAQEYVKSADLIIYPMNSAQPGRSTDLSELEGLIIAGKRILILITRCDNTETDEDDNGEIIHYLQIKDDAARKDQQDHVQNELAALCQKLKLESSNATVLTLSIRYAEKNNNSPEAIEKSGVQKLFEELESILTTANSIELKKQAPHKNLRDFYSKLLANEGKLAIANLIAPLKSAIEDIGKKREELNQLTETATARIESSIINIIDELVEQYAGSRNIKALVKELEQAIKKVISDEYEKPLKEIWQTALNTLYAIPQNMSIDSSISFSDKQAEIKVDISRKSAAIGTGAGAIIGGIAGFLIGGPIGAAIGSTAAGAAGGAAGSIFNSQETRSITVGDNREEIKDELIRSSMKYVQSSITTLHNETLKQVLDPITDSLTTLLQHTDNLQNYIKEQMDV